MIIKTLLTAIILKRMIKIKEKIIINGNDNLNDLINEKLR